jgi:uncharacterized membrane protein YbhN (UPF0104 family)
VNRRLAARWGIGLALVGGLVLTLDPTAIAAELAGANLPLVVVGILGLTALHLVGAVAWRDLTRRLAEITLPWSDAVRTYYAAQAIGGVTPANLGSDAYRVMVLRSSDAGAGRIALPILVQRATSYLALSLLAAGALLVASRPAGFTVGVTLAALGASTIGIAILSLVSVGPGPLRSVRNRLIGEAVVGRRAMIGSAAVGLTMGVAFHAAAVLLTWGIVLAVEPAAASLAALAAVTLARLSLVVPITPSGLGVQEVALAGLFVGIGLPAESAVAAALLARLSMLLTAGIGALAWAGSRPSVEPGKRQREANTTP